MIACMKERPSKSQKAYGTVEATTHSSTLRQHPLKRRGELFKLFWITLPLRPKRLYPRPAYYFHNIAFDR